MILIGNQMVYSWNQGIISLAFCPHPNIFPRLSLVTIWLHILTVSADYEPWAHTFALRFLGGLITEGLIFHGAFNRNKKTCFETSYKNADQNASLIFTVFLFLFFFFFFQFQNFLINLIRFHTSYPGGLESDVFFCYSLHKDGPTGRGAYKTAEV